MNIEAICIELVSGTRYFADPIRTNGYSWPIGCHKVGPLEVEIIGNRLGSGEVFNTKIQNPTQDGYPIARIGFQLSSSADVVLETGYQSWSQIRRTRPGDVKPSRRITPLMARGCYHADPKFAGKVVAGDQYLIWESNVNPTSKATDSTYSQSKVSPVNRTNRGYGAAACFLDAKEHLSTIHAYPDTIKESNSASLNEGIWAWALMDGIILQPHGERTLDPLWISEGDPGKLYSELADHWGHQAGARLDKANPVPAKHPGWCTWYQYFWKISPSDLRSNLEIGSKHGLAMILLDDGYAAAMGDWTQTKPKWSKPGSTPWDLAQEIVASGVEPGIWTAPFFAARKSKIYAEHPDWVVRANHFQAPLPVFYNPIEWKGWVWALDTTRPDVLDHLRNTYSTLRERGFSFHKIDFCYAATMPGRRVGDGKMTRAQGLRAGLQAVREGIGESSYLLGCGCPFGPAVGVVDGMRISPDVGSWWNPTLLKWPPYPDTAPSASNAIRATLLRSPLGGRLFRSDPDCLLLRPVKTRLSRIQRQVLADTIAGTGGFTVLSDDLSLYSENEWMQLDRMASFDDTADGPFDIVDPFSQEITITSKASELKVNLGSDASSPITESDFIESTSSNLPSSELKRK